MDSNILAAIIGALIGSILTMVGAYFIYRLNEDGVRKRENAERARRADSLRTMIRLEIKGHLDLLQGYWPNVRPNTTPEDGISDDKARGYARRLIDRPLPEFSSDAYQSQLGFFPEVFHERTILEVLHHYERLRKAVAIRDRLLIASKDESGTLTDTMAFPGGGSQTRKIGVGREFEEIAPKYWREIDSIMTTILNSGNPLEGSRK